MNFGLDTRCDSKKDKTKRLLDENKAFPSIYFVYSYNNLSEGKLAISYVSDALFVTIN